MRITVALAACGVMAFVATVLPAQIERPPVTAGTLSIVLIGNAAVEITDGTLTLVTDFPYKSGAFGYMTFDDSAIPRRKDVVSLITHRHDDHVDVEALRRLGWRVVGPKEVTAQLPADRIIADSGLGSIAPGLRIVPMTTPHAKVEHRSYLVEWGARRFYFSGDTEDASSLLGLPALDIAFVSPWQYRAAKQAGTISAKRVVIYHHTAQDRATLGRCTGSCEVPTQGQHWSLPLR